MSRHKRIQSPARDEPSLDISSLIDVCFLLLIYFLVTTQIVQKEQELSSSLPTQNPSGPAAEIPALSLLIDANGHISLKSENGHIHVVESDPNTRTLPTLSQRLKLHKSIANTVSQPALVQISVDGNAAQQRVIDVLNALAGANITEITFTQPLNS